MGDKLRKLMKKAYQLLIRLGYFPMFPFTRRPCTSFLTILTSYDLFIPTSQLTPADVVRNDFA